MGKFACPGQDMRFWQPGDIFDVTCANCGYPTEFFKDDAKRRCPECYNLIVNPRLSLGCAQWCEHVHKCLGFDPMDREENNMQEVALLDQLIVAMKKVFGDDQKRIDHSLAVLRRAKEIIDREEADHKVVMASAVLHDIGIHEAERKHGSSAGVYQQIEGPPIARPIMEDLNMDDDSVDHVLKIIANHHTAKDIDTPEFRILWDSDWIVNIPDEYPGLDNEKMKKMIEKIFKTETGKKKAYEIFVQPKTF